MLKYLIWNHVLIHSISSSLYPVYLIVFFKQGFTLNFKKARNSLCSPGLLQLYQSCTLASQVLRFLVWHTVLGFHRHFWGMALLCSPSSSQIHDPLASASQRLRLLFLSYQEWIYHMHFQVTYKLIAPISYIASCSLEFRLHLW